jgi:uncharacterized membrane protein
MSGIAFFILQNMIIKHHDEDFTLRKAVGKDYKGKLSIVIYIIGLILSFINPWIAISCYIFVAIIWVVPDRRIEKNIN